MDAILRAKMICWFNLRWLSRCVQSRWQSCNWVGRLYILFYILWLWFWLVSSSFSGCASQKWNSWVEFQDNGIRLLRVRHVQWGICQGRNKSFDVGREIDYQTSFIANLYLYIPAKKPHAIPVLMHRGFFKSEQIGLRKRVPSMKQQLLDYGSKILMISQTK